MSVQLPLQFDLSKVESSKAIRKGQTTNGKADGIFGWYRYIQDFTHDFAIDWLKELAKPGDVIWDPFSGSGTTLVAAKHLGLESTGYDLNPFMVDVAQTKVDWSLDPKIIRQSLHEVTDAIEKDSTSEPSKAIRFDWDDYDAELSDSTVVYPDDKKLRRWISPRVIRRLQILLFSIDSVEELRARRFLRLAAASILIPASNMAFRPNICYERHPTKDFPVVREFIFRAEQMLKDYEVVFEKSIAPATVSIGDARVDGPNGANLIFTSPPYPNDMEYIHQTRLELSLLSYVENARGLTSLKKTMISSSVKLVYSENAWQKTLGLEIPGVRAVYEPIAKTLEGRGWGWNPANMTAQYFGGMRTVLRNWKKRMVPGAIAAVVLGDSAFNGVKVPTDILFAETAEAEGLLVNDIQVFRRRWNSKHDIELRESVVLLENRPSACVHRK